MLRATVEDRQARGQWGAHHFDKLLAGTIPSFDPANPLHTALATAGHHAGTIAAQVPLKEGAYFTTARRRIRDELTGDGIAAEINGLVKQLLRSP